MSLVVVGSVAFDAIETPFGKCEKTLGGAAYYISLVASYFTKNVKLIGVVGDDYPISAIETLQKKGVNIEGLQIKKGEKTFFWSGRYGNDMNTRDTLVTDLNVLGSFEPIVPESYQDCKYLLLGNLSPLVQQSVIRQMKRRPELIVMDTMNFWIEAALPDLLETLKLVDVLSINDEEARQLSGQYSLIQAAEAILQMGPKVLIIKKGEHGALMFKGKNVFFAPALPIAEVYDPTGAGDSFVGGFVGYLAGKGRHDFQDMKTGLIHGALMASFCVENMGIEGLLDLSDHKVKERFNDFIELSQFDLEIK